jgi:ubiquinone/menaquinone biosynthesis C-methylase UbiE
MRKLKLKSDWHSHLHKIKKREVECIFSKCPEKLFQMGLELGAGDGFQSTLLTKYISKLISTDYNPYRLKRKSNKSIEYRICDAETINNIFNKKQFDIVFSSNLLEHVPHPQKVLKGTYEILKDNGITIHIVPSPFWKLCHLLLHIPNKCIVALDLLINKRNAINIEKNKKYPKLGNNPKTQKKRRIFFHRLLMPEPHGVSTNNFKEFYAFSKLRWKREFEKANFELIRIIKGPVVSGYGFGLDFLRNILERFGFTSEYIYIAVKKEMSSPYTKYF